ncbi:MULTISPECIES: hypothetical protein [Vibrio]|uniref:hypothetical protein n=1 Tax=Vibrio TaxID=662 RepID=UPI000E4DBC63|nr:MULTISPECIES: hypothetical protein [Vibrio]AXT74223.1 hypothetical protein DBX26_24955 [Vibrio sp. dhg]EJM7154687.1 hypothetical protein [Vibrio parahaemolyticus]EJS2611042.1 hypothetical protein [Vibrio alginolyticus]MCA2452349.1 hypothetical protein [Vibrio alginolyticus]MCA2476344.1 hypothetical protein [Vibrio alginolyticus]
MNYDNDENIFGKALTVYPGKESTQDALQELHSKLVKSGLTNTEADQKVKVVSTALKDNAIIAQLLAISVDSKSVSPLGDLTQLAFELAHQIRNRLPLEKQEELDSHLNTLKSS